MIAVRRRCRLAFVRGALETLHTPQNLAGMVPGSRHSPFMRGSFLRTTHGRPLIQLRSFSRYKLPISVINSWTRSYENTKTI